MNRPAIERAIFFGFVFGRQDAGAGTFALKACREFCGDS